MKRLLALLLLIPSLCSADGFFGPYISNALPYTWAQPQVFSGGFSTPSATITGGTAIYRPIVDGSSLAVNSASGLPVFAVDTTQGSGTARVIKVFGNSATPWLMEFLNPAYSSTIGFRYYMDNSGNFYFSSAAVGLHTCISHDPSALPADLCVSGDGSTLIGTSVSNGVDKLQVNGSMTASIVKTAGYTVSTLPAGVIGSRGYVTDATACTFMGTLTGGGTVVCPVFFNGTSWLAE